MPLAYACSPAGVSAASTPRRSSGSGRRRTSPSFSSRSINWVMLERTQCWRWASSESGNGAPASARGWSTPSFASDKPSGLTAASSRDSTASAVSRSEDTTALALLERRARFMGPLRMREIIPGSPARSINQSSAPGQPAPAAWYNCTPAMSWSR